MIDFLDNLSGAELVALSSIIAIMISQELTPNEISILGNFFTTLGDNLNTIASTDTNNILPGT